MFSKEWYSAAGLANCPNVREDITGRNIRAASQRIRDLQDMLPIVKGAYTYHFQVEGPDRVSNREARRQSLIKPAHFMAALFVQSSTLRLRWVMVYQLIRLTDSSNS